jgi:indole-3-glycerol phosphate synthase
MNILEEIAAYARTRVEADRAALPLGALKERCSALAPGAKDFEKALRGPGMSLICEVKKASPSKGVISPDFPYLDIARDYQAAGADALSCLTEPRWFLGSDRIFEEMRDAVSTPMLRKDFTVDEYQIYQARAMGADAVLLICALLDTRKIAEYLELCDSLHLSALVEAHDEQEIAAAVAAGAAVIGVNNRNLKNFQVDFSNAARLRSAIPPHVLYVAESGISGPEDAAALRAIGADAALVGEALMRSPDRRALLWAMRGEGPQ